MTDKPFAEYAVRNAAPILEVLRREFKECKRVLEFGSGTGQHAVAFAGKLGYLQWQTSDLDENHAGINAWIDDVRLDNIDRPLSLDVRTASITRSTYDAAYSSNTAHIMGIDAVECMFALVGKALVPNGVFCLYGPFRVGGAFNTQSNEAFDTDLRQRDPVMGIRDIEQLDEFGGAGGLERQRLYAVPSNNCVAIWTKQAVSR